MYAAVSSSEASCIGTIGVSVVIVVHAPSRQLRLSQHRHCHGRSCGDTPNFAPCCLWASSSDIEDADDLGSNGPRGFRSTRSILSVAVPTLLAGEQFVPKPTRYPLVKCRQGVAVPVLAPPTEP